MRRVVLRALTLSEPFAAARCEILSNPRSRCVQYLRDAVHLLPFPLSKVLHCLAWLRTPNGSIQRKKWYM
jgi:hypothetical protein